MSIHNFYAAILAGGRGTRLWPHSRRNSPKQFADITGDGRTMIQSTVDRLTGLVGDDQVYVITGAAYAALTAEQLPRMPEANILVEPSGRNTAPAIGLACIHLQQRDPEAIVAIFPADHVMTQTPAFQSAVRRGVEIARDGFLVTLGIQPTTPHTGYGYIRRGQQIVPDDAAGPPVYRVAEFLEKPERARAESFLRAGGYYWNGGIFISRVDSLLNEMAAQMPEMHAALLEIGAALGTSQAEATLAARWSDMPNTSIDYGIMEGAERVAVVPLDAGWNDVGSWDALDGLLISDDDGNVVIGDALGVESYNNIVYGHGRMIALVGVDDLVVVDTEDALLIGHRNQMQKVKNIVDALKAQERSELL